MENKNNHIKYEDRAKQLIKFTGLDYNNISPTDIDGIIEYKNKAYIIIELKYNNTPLPFGQQLALERMTRDLGHFKDVLIVIADHNIKDPKKDIQLAECKVRKIYMSNQYQWRETKQTMDVKTIINEFIKLIEG